MLLHKSCRLVVAALNMQCVLTQDPGKWQWTWTRGRWWQCNSYRVPGKETLWTWTASSYNDFFFCSTMHKFLVVKVKQWMIPKYVSVLGRKKKLFSKILKSLQAPLFRICLGQIIGKQSSDALICNFIQISLSGWWISKFKHLKSQRLLLPDTTLASLGVVISLKSTALALPLAKALPLALALGTLGLAPLAKLIKEFGTSVSNSSAPGNLATKKPESPGFMSASSTTPDLPGMLLTMQPRLGSNQGFPNSSTWVGRWTLPSSSEDNTSKTALALMHLLWLLLWEGPSTDAYKDCTAEAEGRDLSSCSSTLFGWRCCFAWSIRFLLRSKAWNKKKKKKDQELMAVKKPSWDFFWFFPQLTKVLYCFEE